MKKISVEIDNADLSALNKQVKKGFHISRGEAIRQAIRDLLKKHGKW